MIIGVPKEVQINENRVALVVAGVRALTSAGHDVFIEKDAVWKRFNEDKFWKKHKCIIITGRGQPSRAERTAVG